MSQYLFTHSQQKQEPYKALHIVPASNSQYDPALVGKLQAAEGRKGTIDQLKLNTEVTNFIQKRREQQRKSLKQNSETVL